ncbi:MAG: tripartite tricarboxylate transporter substrate binding protein [Proteobacteria bacterium]|nr:tripartite tricarboxylate transporter substrate binding protein [Pseudomonadota bacterium]
MQEITMGGQGDTAFSRRSVLAALGSALSCGLVTSAFGQEAAFPSRPIRFVMPFPPAGAADLIGRLYTKALAEMTGQAVVPDNKPGANGLIGVQNVQRSPRDGYSVLIGSSSTLAFNAATYKNLPYDPVKDFVPVGLLATLPVVLVTSSRSTIQSFADLVRRAKERPGALNYGTGSTALQLQAEWMNEMAGVKATAITFKGGGEVVSAILSNTVDVALLDLSAASALIRSGQLRGLALGASEAYASLPGVPTTAQLGLNGYAGELWVIAAVATGTPQAIVDYYATQFAKAAEQPYVREWLRERDLGYMRKSVAELRSTIAGDIERTNKLVDRLGLERT